MPSNKKLLQAAAGNAGESLYVEDVFSTYLYTGTSSNRTITNNIDLSGEGGLVWVKSRSNARNHHLVDTERGASTGSSPGKTLYTNSTSAEAINNDIKGFNTDGFDLGTSDPVNNLNETFASWTFRKAEKFFDVVTYTGTAATQSIAHNLGSVPGMIIVKSTTAAGGWAVWHNSLSSSTDHWLRLDWTNAEINQANFWPSAPTDSHFTVGGYAANNAENQTLVAYLFASDAGGFGDDGSESIIKCGSYTGTGAAGLEVDLGFEPQWLMFKRTDSTSDWSMFDVMRGIATGGDDARLRAQGSDAENTFNYVDVTATGFSLSYGGTDMNASGGTYIYIAIRRPMKTPESGTEVFGIDTANSTGNAPPHFSSSFPVDMAIKVDFSESDTYRYRETRSRLVPSRLKLNTTDAQVGSNPSFFAYMDGCYDNNTVNTSHYAWMFKRATGFFDVVAYTGTGATPTVINHNLSVVPEMMILKSRTSNENWMIYHSALGNTSALIFNTTAVLTGLSTWNSTTPNATTFTLGGGGNNGSQSGQNYISYHFATLAGVSKVGSYTGTGSNVDVDCGFSAGARFILIKRTDSTGDWYVWDSERGIVAGNDPYLLLNSTAAEVTSTDYIDPLSSGFTVTSSAPAALNASGGSYIFLAIS